jgi:hypothetical protein
LESFSLNLYEDLISLEYYRESFDRFSCRQREGLPGSQGKTGTVPRTDYSFSIGLPFRQRSLIVSTDIFDGKQSAAYVKYGNCGVLDSFHLSGSNLRFAANSVQGHIKT